MSRWPSAPVTLPLPGPLLFSGTAFADLGKGGSTSWFTSHTFTSSLSVLVFLGQSSQESYTVVCIWGSPFRLTYITRSMIISGVEHWSFCFAGLAIKIKMILLEKPVCRHTAIYVFLLPFCPSSYPTLMSDCHISCFHVLSVCSQELPLITLETALRGNEGLRRGRTPLCSLTASSRLK